MAEAAVAIALRTQADMQETAHALMTETQQGTYAEGEAPGQEPAVQLQHVTSMVDEIDVYRSAKLLLDYFQECAVDVANQRIAYFESIKNSQAAGKWSEIRDAIGVINDVQPPDLMH